MATYLRLFEPDESPIPYQGLMLIAATIHPDLDDIETTYAMMRSHEEVAVKREIDALTAGGAKLERHTVRGDLANRVLVGAVVLELFVHALKYRSPPSVNDGLRQVARFGGISESQKVRERTPGSESFENALDRTRKAFMKYRPISHFLAILSIDAYILTRVENEKGGVARAAGLARGFEDFLDNNVFMPPAQGNALHAKWDPIRVPRDIEPVTGISFDRSILDR